MSCARAGFGRRSGRSPISSASLDLVALGTVADVVPLKGLNRAFVAKGLAGAAPARSSRAHRADGRRAARRPAGALASRLPARAAHQCRRPHRAGDARRRPAACRTIRPSARALPPNSTASTASARRSRLPRWRRRKPKPWPRSASKRRARSSSPPPKAGIRAWSGLVAARLKERFGRPAFAIALEPGGIGTGSGRSIPGVDLGRAVRQAVSEGLLIKGGGHAMAAGVTLRKDALAAFRAYLEDALAAAVRSVAARGCAA